MSSRRGLQVSIAFTSAVAFLFVTPQVIRAQAPASLAERIQKVMSRPEFAHANFGIEFYSLDTGKVIYALNGNKLFVPASTTKTLTEGTVLAKLGADYRFHTRIYRTGSLDKKGTLKGDLVLVASGDPDLSNRIQQDNTLAFVDEDHSYGGPALPGDPLAVIKELAKDVASKVKKIQGRVLVDASLFPDGGREGGTGVIVSSIVVNDNVIDLIATPGAKAGDAVKLEVSPKTAYATFVNHLTTSAAGSQMTIDDAVTVTNADGSVTVTLSGSLPAGSHPLTAPYAVPSPTNFAQTVLTESLKSAGIEIKPPKNAAPVDFKTLATSYTPENQIAEHVSLPLSEEIKVTLKVSQNLHAAMGPLLLGTLVAKAATDPEHAGFKVEHSFLQEANLDLSGVSQGDGEGGSWADLFAPDFIVHYLAYWSTRPDFQIFFKALPILGKDGTLAKIQTASPAAGHIFAKTGTFGSEDKLNGKMMLNGKGLAGFVLTATGQKLAFAAYVNHVSLPPDPDSAQEVAGQALGEIAAAAYDAPMNASATPESGVTSSPGGGGGYDLIIRNGHILDGTGNPWYSADVAVQGDRIAAIGDLRDAHAKRELDAAGLIVSPGFIDMLGQSETALLLDKRSLSKLSQGITSEITGEGGSIAPQNEKTLAPLKPFLDHYQLTVDWTTLDGYFRRLEKQGTPLNIGTYVGSAQVREAVIGDDDRAPTPAELEQMEGLVEQAMKDGALGVSSALIYPPNIYAKTDELIALAKVASKYGGLYATHMRSEGANEMAALAEAIRIGREAHLPVEVFHLKVSGKPRWGNMRNVVATIQAARDSGLDIAADMYPYPAGATALASALPPWVADGGVQKLLERLKDPTTRARIKQELTAGDHPDWENLFYDCGGGSGVLLGSVEKPELKQFEGKTVEDVAKAWRKSPEDALMDFVLADSAQTGAIYFMASEEDIKTGLEQPWTSIGLDANEMSLDGPIFEPHTHPRALGAMPRFLGHYVRDEHLMPLPAAIRKITSLPAQREHLRDRGLLKPGFFADITIFDAAKIIDHATFTEPTQLSEGVAYTIVNGQIEFDHGKLTAATAGQVLRGRGYQTAH
ncbi:MAG TPA: D-alanyl-D-alanine carboxypeptidase/D-alanyl-D-alanine-endopeptidase [Candidatus Methylomirabilis sp.]|nr:D-alanyl-D-alanine carboxypeptidase/D-alanyl-D-alanine-endopeptidase [Candidatus Methylomirabilis sp.]